MMDKVMAVATKVCTMCCDVSSKSKDLCPDSQEGVRNQKNWTMSTRQYFFSGMVTEGERMQATCT